MQTMKNRVIRTDDDLWTAAKAVAEKEGTTVSAVVRRLLSAYVKAAALLVLAAVALSACGSQEAPSSPVAVSTAPVATPGAETSDEAVSEAAVIPTEVIQVGTEQVAHVDGQSVRVKVYSFDPADAGLAVEVNSGGAPFVVDAAAFVLVDASGAEIIGVAAKDAWDRSLAANDQTMGQVRFAGATAPVLLTYSPAGADAPLVWSFV